MLLRKIHSRNLCVGVVTDKQNDRWQNANGVTKGGSTALAAETVLLSFTHCMSKKFSFRCLKTWPQTHKYKLYKDYII